MIHADAIEQAIERQLEIERKAAALDNILTGLQTTISTAGDQHVRLSFVVQLILEQAHG